MVIEQQKIPEFLGVSPENEADEIMESISQPVEKLDPDAVIINPEQRRLLHERMAEIVAEAYDKQVDSLIFLDKSARPLVTLFTELWKHQYPETDRPPITFIQIGGETTSYLPTTDNEESMQRQWRNIQIAIANRERAYPYRDRYSYRHFDDPDTSSLYPALIEAKQRYAHLKAATQTMVIDEIEMHGSTRRATVGLLRYWLGVTGEIDFVPVASPEVLDAAYNGDPALFIEPNPSFSGYDPYSLFGTPEFYFSAPWQSVPELQRFRTGYTGTLDSPKPSLTAAAWTKNKEQLQILEDELVQTHLTQSPKAMVNDALRSLRAIIEPTTVKTELLRDLDPELVTAAEAAASQLWNETISTLLSAYVYYLIEQLGSYDEKQSALTDETLIEALSNVAAKVVMIRNHAYKATDAVYRSLAQQYYPDHVELYGENSYQDRETSAGARRLKQAERLHEFIHQNGVERAEAIIGWQNPIEQLARQAKWQDFELQQHRQLPQRVRQLRQEMKETAQGQYGLSKVD